MHIPTAALSALSATCLFVGSHAQASADCQALTAKFIVQVAMPSRRCPFRFGPLLPARAQRRPTRTLAILQLGAQPPRQLCLRSFT